MSPALSRFLVATLVLAVLPGGFGAQPPQPQEIVQFLQTLVPQPPAPAAVAVQNAEAPRSSTSARGYLRYVGAAPGSHFPPQAGVLAGPPEAVARGFLITHGRLFGVQSPGVDFALRRERQNNGRSYVRLQQTYRGIPIVAAEVVVQVDAQGGVESILADLETETGPLDNGVVPTVPILSAEAAAASAGSVFAAQEAPGRIETTPAQLAIFAPSVLDEPGDPALVWDLEISAPNSVEIHARVLVDALHGKIVRVWSLVYPALNRHIYDADTSTNNPGNLVRAEGQAASGIADADDAYTFLGDTYNFYFSHHGRDSIDAKGKLLSATVRFCGTSTNGPVCPPEGQAFYSGGRMYFGADRVADDVTGHELTHGVTAVESGLIYNNVSGAINESFSDIWGEFIDLSNNSGNDSPAVRWDLGEDLPGGRARSMSNPPILGQPDRLNSPRYQQPANTNDHGGVHVNSGVNNKLCYLLTDGDTFNGQTIRGLGLDQVVALYYEVQVNLLTSGAGWTELYNTLQQAAVNLGWNTADRNNLHRACMAVEIATGGTDLYVDKTSFCPLQTGGQNCELFWGPFVSVAQGVGKSQPGDTLHIRTGSYNEPMTIDKIVTLQAQDGWVYIGR